MKKLFSIILAVLMLMAIAVPALAADETPDVVTPGVVTIPVKLTVNGNNDSPVHAFTFTLAAVGNAPLPDPENTSYTATIAATNSQTPGTGSFDIDFRTAKFNAPGEYKYTLTEETAPAAPFSYKDGETGTREIIVYVIANDAGTLEIATSFMHKDADNEDKSEGFEYEYTTVDLKLTKTVTGNQRDPKAAFTFTIELSDVAADGVYTLSNGSTITVNNGSGSVEVTLKNGEDVTIKGLPVGYSYTITEKEATDYTTTIVTNGDEDSTEQGKKTTDTEIDEDVTVAYTNTKNGEIPTGVLLTIAPFAALMVIGVAGVLFVVLKKRAK